MKDGNKAKPFIIGAVVLVVIAAAIFALAVPFVKTTGTVIKETHSSGRIIIDEGSSDNGKTEILQNSTIRFRTSFGQERTVNVYLKYADDYPVRLSEGTSVTIVYNPIFPDNARLANP